MLLSLPVKNIAMAYKQLVKFIEHRRNINFDISIAGLMHGVIANSGSAMADFAIDLKPVEHAITFARLTGCVGPLTEIAECMRNTSLMRLKTSFYIFSVSFRLDV
jgi:hypothetical protein